MLNKKKQKIPEITEFTNAEGVTYQVVFRSIQDKDLYGIGLKAAAGLCSNPEEPNPQILIDPNLPNKRTLQVILEEMVHAHMWKESEKVARTFARNTARLIIESGWQKPKKCNKKNESL